MILHDLVDDLQVARAAIDGGATLIQLRLKNLSTAQLVEQGMPFRDLCASAHVTFMVNDDVEAAIRLEADGVHLGREDEGLEQVDDCQLQVLPRLGGEVHHRPGQELARLLRRVGAPVHVPDYLGVGPVWNTPTKAGVPPLGLHGLHEICESVAAPVVAIGGIDATKAALCLEAGAVGVAVVRGSRDAAAVRTALERAAV